MKSDPKLEREFFGLRFKNPVGMAAGFDKNAMYYNQLADLGFGFVEVGTVTPVPQDGNPQPRLFRLPADQGLINRMGFNNGGVEEMVERLKKRNTDIIIGGNIGKNKVTPNENATDDYMKCFNALHPYVDYFAVNVSSPNTPGLRELQEKEPLTHLLNTLKKANAQIAKPRPILLKIAPDLTNEQLDDIIDIIKETGLDGVIATNTTNSRAGLKEDSTRIEEIGAGGLSGAPVRVRSTEVIRYLKAGSENKFKIIGVGGIVSPQDALEKLDAGADLIQVYSGFVYEGPSMCKKINKAILERTA